MVAVLGIGAAVWAPSVCAAPQVMPDRWTQFVTDDGWVVDVNTTNEVIDHIDNLAGASNSWQARVTLRSEARIGGQGASVIQDAQLESGYFVGCRTDSSAGVEVGGDLGLDL
ncbi:MspA family porin, partial [Mycolicibacterium porcinum]